jgi:hypothetical protein
MTSRLTNLVSRAYLNAKTDPPAIGLDAAAVSIEAAVDLAGEKIGENAKKIYAELIALALESVADGYAPMVFHNFPLASRVTKLHLIAEDSTPYKAMTELEALGIVSEIRVKGRVAWIPTALERERKGKQTTATAEPSKLAEFILGGQTEQAKPVRKPKLVGKKLADLAELK